MSLREGNAGMGRGARAALAGVGGAVAGGVGGIVAPFVLAQAYILLGGDPTAAGAMWILSLLLVPMGVVLGCLAGAVLGGFWGTPTAEAVGLSGGIVSCVALAGTALGVPVLLALGQSPGGPGDGIMVLALLAWIIVPASLVVAAASAVLAASRIRTGNRPRVLVAIGTGLLGLFGGLFVVLAGLATM